jgi:putative ABC transport system substrate-binding protein
VKRRDFIAGLGGAAVWPVVARAQQAAKLPTIGYLSAISKGQTELQFAAFHRGLNEAGFVEGRNIAVEYRWADGQYNRLSAMADDLVQRGVALIVAQAPPAAIAAKAATSTIPIVFVVGFDPVAAGLAASFNRPGGNATGMTLLTAPLGQKRIELIRELNPQTVVVAMLANPVSPDAAPEIRDVEAAAQAFKLHLKIFNVSTSSELSNAPDAIAALQPDAVLIGSDPFLLIRREEIVSLAARIGCPTVYPFREFADSGGLMSYGTNIPNAYVQAGIYAGRILKGAKPSELPIQAPVNFELVINLKTAKTLGIDVPLHLQQRADEVIE